MYAHPVRKFVIDFLRRIIIDSLSMPGQGGSGKTAPVIDVVLEVLIILFDCLFDSLFVCLFIH